MFFWVSGRKTRTHPARLCEVQVHGESPGEALVSRCRRLFLLSLDDVQQLGLQHRYLLGRPRCPYLKAGGHGGKVIGGGGESGDDGERGEEEVGVLFASRHRTGSPTELTARIHFLACSWS